MNCENQLRLFVDMDGVICAFEEDFISITGVTLMDYENEHGMNSFWSVIDAKGEPFWSEMSWMSDGKELWDYVTQYNPTILSAPSKDSASATGKVKWLKNNVKLPNYNVQRKCRHGWDGVSKIILNSDKYRYATGEKDILIDDTPKKINAWVKAGGTGILHKNTVDTISKLKELGL